jgi:hypothetical protein
MEILLETDFYYCIRDYTEKQCYSMDIKNAYKSFTHSIFSFCKSEIDHISLFLILNYTRIEFVSIQNRKSEYESGKK